MTNVYPLQHTIYQAKHRLLCFEFRRPVIVLGVDVSNCNPEMFKVLLQADIILK